MTIWWTSPPPLLQIHLLHQIAMGTPCHVPLQRCTIIIFFEVLGPNVWFLQTGTWHWSVFVVPTSDLLNWRTLQCFWLLALSCQGDGLKCFKFGLGDLHVPAIDLFPEWRILNGAGCLNLNFVSFCFGEKFKCTTFISSFCWSLSLILSHTHTHWRTATHCSTRTAVAGHYTSVLLCFIQTDDEGDWNVKLDKCSYFVSHRTLFDWCCFYYSIRNSIAVLVEFLFAPFFFRFEILICCHQCLQRFPKGWGLNYTCVGTLNRNIPSTFTHDLTACLRSLFTSALNLYVDANPGIVTMSLSPPFLYTTPGTFACSVERFVTLSHASSFSCTIQ